MVDERYDIIGLANELGIRNLRRGSGHEYTASCPFSENHPNGDRHPSFGINAESGLWLCRSCGEKGNAVQLVEKVLGCDWHEARRVAALYGDEQDPMAILERMAGNQVETPHRPMPEISGFSSECEYWEGRGLDYVTCERYSLGFDMVNNRPVVPHIVGRELLGWQERSIDGSLPKWSSSAGFPRSDTLFGVDQVADADVVVLVEAPVSAMWLTQLGYPSVASFGCQFTYGQSVELRKRFSGAVIWYDPDEAGYNGARRVVELLRDYVDLWSVAAPPGDPNECSPDEVADVMGNIYEVGGIEI